MKHIFDYLIFLNVNYYNVLKYLLENASKNIILTHENLMKTYAIFKIFNLVVFYY